ncbi:15299_t:CDS:2, partial [Rhizophagus irregularis]
LGVDATRGESCSLASSKHKNRYRIVQGIVKSARKALERRVYECFGSNGNGSPGPTETPSNNSAPNGAPLDSKVQDPCRFVWIPVGDPNKISISNDFRSETLQISTNVNCFENALKCMVLTWKAKVLDEQFEKKTPTLGRMAICKKSSRILS